MYETAAGNSRRAGGSGSGGARGLIVLLVLASLALGIRASKAEGQHTKTVLLLYSFSDPSLYDSLDALKGAIRSRAREPVNFEVEYLEPQRLQDSAYEKSLGETLANAYRGTKFDAVVVAAYPALRFAVAHRDQIFPNVPIVFSYMSASRFRNQKLPPGVTGVTLTVDARGAVALALRLRPDTKNVALISGVTEHETYWRQNFHNEFVEFQDRLKLIDLDWRSTDELMQQVSRLPAGTAVFVEVLPQFSAAAGVWNLRGYEGDRPEFSYLLRLLCFLRRSWSDWRNLCGRVGTNQ